ncbi:SAM-dependent methyltransferase [Apilactobacillus micheneri]|uniref:SAM-dependent methyltransferase n=1 Tax=Apilactobacillus micheneri TaxID=1899430 RepID=A0ABY2YY46_9LACO|nr:SAM-dependent methyltransferase [Apilactobacillus micheneri]TPR24508.1 SAM-dependent methyltransferase [Apilactobacillus micheneri]TPR25819.1 SAM-dependent methyltransferase [Apilactobacillus micheneri]TPR28009.1 SAM-dependent methyltransferase [Apilactobacillus micheneri]TPR29500.1 SAM-dependent methyltransferase [Apilactobacillus micheneri]TPR30286.1 SAM-dependent methyltransferase [Apilactobacillus micheneri]
MNKKQLIKKLRKNKKIVKKPSYIERMKKYRKIFSDFPAIIFLVNNILEADRLLRSNQLPQDLPELILPDNIQDEIFQFVNNQYSMNDREGDKVWNKYVDQLPILDKDLRSFRDYLEAEYGMWAYISAPFTNGIAKYLNGKKTLEVMAGNGYISKGLRDARADVICTDSMSWQKENETGHHLVTNIEKLDANAAFDKYKHEIDVVIMCWSPDGVDIDWQLLQKIREYNKDIHLIVIGEKYGATDSKSFWDNAKIINSDIANELNKHHRPFDLIKDQLYFVN